MKPIEENAPEGAAGLEGLDDELRRIAEDGDRAVTGQPSAQEQQEQEQAQAVAAVASRGAELGAMLQLAVQMAGPALPFIPKCYPPETCDQIGAAVAAVADKYGWNLDGLNSPELALAVVAIPPTAQAVILGRAYFAEQRAAREHAERMRREGREPFPKVEGLDGGG